MSVLCTDFEKNKLMCCHPYILVAPLTLVLQNHTSLNPFSPSVLCKTRNLSLTRPLLSLVFY